MKYNLLDVCNVVVVCCLFVFFSFLRRGVWVVGVCWEKCSTKLGQTWIGCNYVIFIIQENQENKIYRPLWRLTILPGISHCGWNISSYFARPGN